MDKFKLFTFNSTHQALLSEKTLKDFGIAARLIPVPRNISASCGLAARVSVKDFDAASKAIKKRGIEVSGIYDI